MLLNAWQYLDTLKVGLGFAYTCPYIKFFFLSKVKCSHHLLLFWLKNLPLSFDWSMVVIDIGATVVMNHILPLLSATTLLQESVVSVGVFGPEEQRSCWSSSPVQGWAKEMALSWENWARTFRNWLIGLCIGRSLCLAALGAGIFKQGTILLHNPVHVVVFILFFECKWKSIKS